MFLRVQKCSSLSGDGSVEGDTALEKWNFSNGRTKLVIKCASETNGKTWTEDASDLPSDYVPGRRFPCQVVALSTHVPFHPLNAWRSGVRGQLNGFVHGGYQVKSELASCLHVPPASASSK